RTWPRRPRWRRPRRGRDRGTSPPGGDPLDREPATRAADATARGWSRHPALFEVVLELPRPRRVAKLPERLGLDLADPLAGDIELLAHFLEGPGTPVLEAEAELEDAP